MPVTETLVVDPAAPDAAALQRAGACLRAGGLVAFPTETVYGLGAHALDAAAVRRIFEAKGRPASDPLIVHIAALDQLHRLVRAVPPAARQLAHAFWPGPLTLVLPRTSAVPDAVTAGLETVGIRIPSHPVARALLREAAIPVAAPSANLFSRPSPTRAAHVRDDLDGRIELIVDGGATTMGVESTVLDLSGDVPRVLRPGGVTVEQLRDLIGEVDVREVVSDGSSAQASPGLLLKHYSPRAPLTLYEGEPGDALVALEADARAAREAGRVVIVLDFGADADVTQIAAGLYDRLRSADAAHPDLILARGCSAREGLGRAITDRLRRAAAGRIVRA